MLYFLGLVLPMAVLMLVASLGLLEPGGRLLSLTRLMASRYIATGRCVELCRVVFKPFPERIVMMFRCGFFISALGMKVTCCTVTRLGW
jgi:hypothetical protein